MPEPKAEPTLEHSEAEPAALTYARWLLSEACDWVPFTEDLYVGGPATGGAVRYNGLAKVVANRLRFQERLPRVLAVYDHELRTAQSVLDGADVPDWPAAWAQKRCPWL